MKSSLRFLAGLAAASVVVFCLSAALASGQAETTTPTAAANLLYIFSNSSPHITVIDADTNEIIKTANLPDFTAWSWNDDNNYFDGENLWLGMKDPDTKEAEVVALNLDTLEITGRVPIGVEQQLVYIGKGTRDGRLLVSKQAAGEVYVIDPQAFEVLDVWDDVPLNGGIACDADVGAGPDDVERFYIPTRQGDTVVSLDAGSGETLETFEDEPGYLPYMLTVAPDGNIWVQEQGNNSNVVLDPVTLGIVGRIPTGKSPALASFSADGHYGFISYLDDTIVTVVDTVTLDVIAKVEAGRVAQKLAVHPDGAYIYAILTQEAGVAVIESSTWSVAQTIPIGTNPSGIYLRPASAEGAPS
jgi:YVTN family beta-propeller protein